MPNADGTIESPSPEGNPLTQIAEHHIPLHLSLTGNLMSSHNYSSRSELWIRIHWIWIRIQGFDDQKLKKKKNTAEIYFLSFLIKNRTAEAEFFLQLQYLHISEFFEKISLKALSHEIDFKNFDKNLQNLV